MAKSKRYILLLLIVGYCSCVVAQDRYMVFFTDKSNSPYSINVPEEFLSQKAINRAAREPINENDLPVNPNYIADLKAEGVNVLYTTKWMNGALVEATELQMMSMNLTFVSSYVKVAPNTKPIAEGRMEGKDENNGRNELTFVQNEILGVPKMHEDGYTGSGVRVAVLDAGFTDTNINAYLKHVFDDNRINLTYDFARQSEYVYSYSTHGANVFSIFGSYVESSYVGGGYGANFDLFITEYVDTEFPIEEYNWLFAAEKADSAGVDIITSSVGYFDFDAPMEEFNYTHDDLDGKTAIITQAAEMAFSRGMLVITSAGNQGNKPWEKITFPADGENVIAVGAVKSNDTSILSEISSLGPTFDDRVKPDVVAVGDRATYIDLNSVITTGLGTSYSAPQIAGLAAGLWQKYPELSNAELKDIIIQSGNRASNPDNSYGYGIPNYIRASQIKEGVFTGIIDSEDEDIIVYPNPVTGDFVHIRTNNLKQKSLLEVINVHGQRIVETSINQYSEAEIDVSNLRMGMYWVRISNDQQFLQSTIVVE